ncbi:MAG: hypothetical protein HN377_09770 [Alphaproteobacteria bacterium]|jgi:hypothetical protein|nr:hypothetical protein [Alphaproteobacteria bacterium]
MSKDEKRYVGINNEINAGMTDTAKIIRDAWTFGVIPETETCENWTAGGLQDLWDKVNARWEEYGFKVQNLPNDIRERFERIQKDAVEQAHQSGWDPDRDIQDDT